MDAGAMLGLLRRALHDWDALEADLADVVPSVAQHLPAAAAGDRTMTQVCMLLREREGGARLVVPHWGLTLPTKSWQGTFLLQQQQKAPLGQFAGYVRRTLGWKCLHSDGPGQKYVRLVLCRPL